MVFDNCEICIAIRNSSESSRKIWNTRLFESDNFLILPSIGPLIGGQAMIVSKDHYSNLLTIPALNDEEFENLANYSETKVGDRILFVEHGSFIGQMGGCCIEHAHVHILPGFNQFYNILDNTLPISTEVSKYNQIFESKEISFPYILTFNLQEQIRLYKAYNVPSQMMRMAICTQLGRPDWNWKQNKRIDLIQQTLEIWKL